MERYIYGFDRSYVVNDSGQVFSISKYDRKRMSPHITQKGYLTISFRRMGKNVVKSIHRLVAMAFVEGFSKDKQVNHINGNKTDNRATNLEWVTQLENIRHSRKIGLYDNRGEKHSMHKLKEKDVLHIRQLLSRGKLQYKIAKTYGVNKTCIGKISRGETWKSLK